MKIQLPYIMYVSYWLREINDFDLILIELRGMASLPASQCEMKGMASLKVNVSSKELLVCLPM
jgi:hypothetical protein